LPADEAPHAYLVVAFMEESTAVTPVRSLVVRLIRHLSPKGAYSITVNRQQGLALMCGFEVEGDATKFAAAVRAKPIGRYGGWKSQRGFLLDGRKHAAILKAMSG
jgi:hypothetical protein